MARSGGNLRGAEVSVRRRQVVLTELGVAANHGATLAWRHQRVAEVGERRRQVALTALAVPAAHGAAITLNRTVCLAPAATCV